MRVCLLILIFGVGVRGQDVDKPKFPKWKSGEQEGTVTIDGKDEAFVALVPRGYTPSKTWPVVLLAHGNGGNAANFLKAIKPIAGKKPPLLVSLERCDNKQDAVGYVPKYLTELAKQFHLDDENVYALGFSGGGFRLWDDIVCKAEELPRFRGVVLVGCGKQSFDPPEKPEKAATIVFVGDPKDGNYGSSRPAAADDLKAKGYEVIVHEHAGGHTVPRAETEAVFEWIGKTIKESKKKR
jgi:predicted esterase